MLRNVVLLYQYKPMQSTVSGMLPKYCVTQYILFIYVELMNIMKIKISLK